VFSRRKPTIIRARREIGSSGTARPARQIPRDLPVGWRDQSESATCDL